MWDLAVRLEGPLVTLEPLRADHAEGLFAAGRPEAIWTYWPLSLAESRERVDAWTADCLRAAASGERQHYATLDSATGEVVGSTSYLAIQPEHEAIEIGWTWLAPSRWRTGANVDAKRLMLRHAFEALGCHRVQIVTDARNERSRAAIAALPAQFEGVHREDRIVRDGFRRSSAHYSILAPEWPAVERSLAARLDSRDRSGGG
jgi:N-acetyltransferase